IRLIFESCQKLGIRKPEFREDGDFVKIIFYFAPEKQSKQSDESYLLDYLKHQGSVSIQEITQILNISRNTATRKLNQLVVKRKIARVGKGPSVRYEI